MEWFNCFSVFICIDRLAIWSNRKRCQCNFIPWSFSSINVLWHSFHNCFQKHKVGIDQNIHQPDANKAVNIGNASNPSPNQDELQPSLQKQVLPEEAEKYLREAASVEDYPDAKDGDELEKMKGDQ